MKGTTAYAIVWVSCSLAITVAIYITKSASPLWGLIIPTLIRYSEK